MTLDDGEGPPPSTAYGDLSGVGFDLARAGVPPTVMAAARDAIAAIEETRPLLDRHRLRELMDGPLDGHAALHLFSGLVTAGAAEEAQPGRRYEEYTFRMDRDAAVRYLDIQLVAAIAGDALSPEDAGEVELVVGMPEHISIDYRAGGGVRPLDSELRKVLLDADEVVRVANPYFDASGPVIDNLAAIPRHGIDLRILTREVAGNRTTREAIRRLVADVGAAHLGHLHVRDLYATDRAGHHDHAVHAKTVIADADRCYLGSANLMRTGLEANFELGVLLGGPPVQDVIMAFDAAYAAAEAVDLGRV